MYVYNIWLVSTHARQMAEEIHWENIKLFKGKLKYGRKRKIEFRQHMYVVSKKLICVCLSDWNSEFSTFGAITQLLRDARGETLSTNRGSKDKTR